MPLLNDSPLLMNRDLVLRHLAARRVRLSRTKVFFQQEHTLVLPGGRDVPAGTPAGTVPSLLDPAETYLVRVVNAAHYEAADIVVDYAVPNVVNVATSGLFPDAILNRIVYAPSLPFAYETGGDRPLDVLSNFFDTAQPRRAPLIRALTDRFPGYRNVTGVFDLPGLARLYGSARILVNAHQTPHHHTIEEFRVLPALSRGAIVISEDVPLRTHVPYHEHVVWCRFEEIPDTVAAVLADYDAVFDRIHGGGRLARRLAAMRSDFARDMDAALARLPAPPAPWDARFWARLRGLLDRR
ncbi:hypothetical protein PQJ75_29855 [Rhodoplanes sp. TEM]|uniref:Glycosyltransferase family 1 protein n=1 Tax=Rhodoplanes tepidamans TaxID=200616 RepID=A0ABT5JL86_RHOTP|nr:MULTISPECIES: hypothetical protein [Rhodoplanes]MDC7790008.1 hypothetical protein [Rhodoplanes tepidamans]MDC7987958.1 hypothetical protein [Rhodoplanes sp. TEM]MDQ0358934.1 hypothetical protein [Rhodoplanes tepidamans]